MTLLKRHILSRKIGSKATKHADLSATGRKGKTMTERELERILAEEPDEAKVWRAMEEYLKGGD